MLVVVVPRKIVCHTATPSYQTMYVVALPCRSLITYAFTVLIIFTANCSKVITLV